MFKKRSTNIMKKSKKNLIHGTVIAASLFSVTSYIGAHNIKLDTLGSGSSIRKQILQDENSVNPVKDEKDEKKGKEGKCGEGKCGKDEKKGKEGKCGEGKCGDKKKDK